MYVSVGIRDTLQNEYLWCRSNDRCWVFVKTKACGFSLEKVSHVSSSWLTTVRTLLCSAKNRQNKHKKKHFSNKKPNNPYLLPQKRRTLYKQRSPLTRNTLKETSYILIKFTDSNSFNRTGFSVSRSHWDGGTLKQQICSLRYHPPYKYTWSNTWADKRDTWWDSSDNDAFLDRNTLEHYTLQTIRLIVNRLKCNRRTHCPCVGGHWSVPVIFVHCI